MKSCSDQTNKSRYRVRELWMLLCFFFFLGDQIYLFFKFFSLTNPESENPALAVGFLLVWFTKHNHNWIFHMCHCHSDLLGDDFWILYVSKVVARHSCGDSPLPCGLLVRWLFVQVWPVCLQQHYMEPRLFSWISEQLDSICGFTRKPKHCGLTHFPAIKYRLLISAFPTRCTRRPSLPFAR